METKKSKILFINPPQTFYPGSTIFSKSFPLGLASVAAVLLREAYDVTILDTLVNKFEIIKDENVTTYGMLFKNIEEEIRISKPDIIGITCPFTAQSENAIKIANIVKQIDKKIITILGGPDSSVRAKTLMENNISIDFAVIGEGEQTMLEFTDKINNNNYEELEKVKGLVLRIEDKIIINEEREFIKNLDSLPFPAYELFNMNAYFDETDEYLYIQRMGRKKRELPIITSRGCPYKCIFCSIHLHMGNKWRSHSAKYVLDHLKHIIEKYGVNHIHFEDDNLTQNIKRTEEILNGIIKNNYKVTWDTPNGVRIDHLDEKILLLMKKAGCVKLTVAIESGDQYVLDKIISKALNLNTVAEIVDKINNVGIPLHSFYIIGFPGEKRENI